MQNRIDQIKRSKITQEIIDHNKIVESEHAMESQKLASDYATTVSSIVAKGNNGITCTYPSPRHRRTIHGDHGIAHGGLLNNGQDQYTGLHTYPLPTTPNTPTSPQGPTPDQLANLPRDCAITTAMTINLQKFAIEECHAK